MLARVGDDYFFAGPAGQPTTPPSTLAHQPPSAAPVSSANLIVGAALLGSLLMLVGSWGPWLKLSVFGFSDTAGGLHSEMDGRYVLALGIAGLLTAGTALTSGQSSHQIRQICAGVLTTLGVVALIIVIHEWVTISDHIRQFNAFAKPVLSQISSTSPSADPYLSAFDGIHVARGWGLWLSGIASSVTGLAGAYLFLVKQV
jgi:hypothetical protein